MVKDRKLLSIEMGRVSPDEYKELPQIGVVVVLDNIRSAHNVGSAFRTCDSFKISATYLIDAPEDVELTISGNIDYLATLTGVEKDGIVGCLQDFVRSKSPYAKTATSDAEVYIDANANKTRSTFTLDDPNGTIVTIVVDGAAGKISAM